MMFRLFLSERGCAWWGLPATRNKRYTEYKKRCFKVLQKGWINLGTFAFRPCSPLENKWAVTSGDALQPQTKDAQRFRRYASSCCQKGRTIWEHLVLGHAPPHSPPGKKGAVTSEYVLQPKIEEEEVFGEGGGRVQQAAQWNQRSNVLHPL